MINDYGCQFSVFLLLCHPYSFIFPQALIQLICILVLNVLYTYNLFYLQEIQVKTFHSWTHSKKSNWTYKSEIRPWKFQFSMAPCMGWGIWMLQPHGNIVWKLKMLWLLLPRERIQSRESLKRPGRPFMGPFGPRFKLLYTTWRIHNSTLFK